MTRSTFDVAQERSDAVERRIADDPSGLRVMTGDRPTGQLHLGHYFGTLANRVRLQQAGVEVFLLIADYQVITDRSDVSSIRQNVRELMLDYLAVGIDASEATIFTHSAVPALNQLMLPFLSLVSAAELQRNPTVKAESDAAGGALSGLLLTYPVHQAADILYCHGNVVPVGRDQLPHLETTRLIAHRFNERYGEVFTEPTALLSETPLVLGTDGGKMSKSANNSIMLAATEDETASLIKRAKTDSERAIRYEPESRPEVSNLLRLAGLCQGRRPEAIAGEIGEAGSGALKKVVTESVNEFLRPMRARRAEFADDPGYLSSILDTGNERANAIADDTLDRVREHMGMVY